jgi:hypothetical protein
MAQIKLTHPSLDHLAATPEIFRALLTGIHERQTEWKPAPEKWSLAEILEHLSHIEGHCFRARLDRMLAEDAPVFEDYDQEAYYRAGAYSGRDAEESFAHWEEQRDDNLAFLAELDPMVLLRKGVHADRGEFTLEQLLNSWAFHDLSHVRQIAGLVGMQIYHPGMGALVDP